MKYIHEYAEYPHFVWDVLEILNLLTTVAGLQGKILGKMQQFGFGIQQEAMLNAMTEEIIKSSEIEGEILNSEQVRSSLARHLNIELQQAPASSHHVEGIVEALIDATKNYNESLTAQRLFGWHAALFPTGYSGIQKINAGAFRNGDMQIVSSKNSREIIHYEAPKPQEIVIQMEQFLNWFNSADNENLLLKSAIAHLWFVIIHPFDDGNGRLARTITEMALARAENTHLRFYSLSAQILKEKKEYYRVLECTTTGGLNITSWLKWFLECLVHSIENTDTVIGKVLKKAEFWKKNSIDIPSPVQRRIINLLLDGFTGNLTSGKVERICKISQDTATRLLKDLVDKGHLEIRGAGRSTHYALKQK
jgi:Fic family protein